MAGFQDMLQFWRLFNLPSFQKELDTFVDDLVISQDQSDASRKKLVEQSRDLKKAYPEACLQLAPLIKSFQSEVDSLTKRCKHGETTLLNVYKRLLDAPDPVRSLENAVALEKRFQRVGDIELENGHLRETITDLKTELSAARNQDVTIASLNSRIYELEGSKEGELMAAVRDKERELTRCHQKEELRSREAVNTSNREVNEANNKVKSLQNQLDLLAKEKFDLEIKYNDEKDAKESEAGLLAWDLEVANQRVAELEKQFESVGERVKEKVVETVDDVDVQEELVAKERRISELVKELTQQTVNCQLLRTSNEVSTGEINEKLLAAESEVERLRRVVESRGDYAEIREELDVLKSLEFPGEDEGVSLERLLMGKNRGLQSEATTLRIQVTELREQADRLAGEVRSGKLLEGDQKELIARLEADVENLQTLYRRPEADGAADPSSKHTEVIENAVLETEAEPEVGNKSLFGIVSSQRERFKLRCQQLEVQNKQLEVQVSSMVQQVETMRKDNVKLYEKVRFLQSYSGKQDDTKLDMDDTSRQYSQDYEDKLNPFTRFNKRERYKRFASMSPFERITFSIGQFILSNKIPRTVTFFYTLILHFLVVLVLYKLAYTQTDIREISLDCEHQFAEHMKVFHHK